MWWAIVVMIQMEKMWSKLIVVSVSSITTSKSNFSAGDIIWIRSSDMEKMAVTKKMLCWTNVIRLVLLLLYSICWRSSITMQSIWRRWWREQYRQSKKLHSLCTMWHNYYVAVLATFDQQVANGFYAPLSEFIQIDFALLKQRKSGKYFLVMYGFSINAGTLYEWYC